MDIIIETTIAVITVLISIAGAFAGIGYYRQGKTQGKLDANALLKQDVDELTKKVNVLTKQVEELRDEIADKNKKLDDLLLILQGKNPDLVNLLSELRNYMDFNSPVFTKIRDKGLPTLERLEKYLDKQSF